MKIIQAWIINNIGITKQKYTIICKKKKKKREKLCKILYQNFFTAFLLPYPKVSFVIKYNPQNSETNFCEKYEGDMLKIIIIMMGYTLNNFITHMTI
jgi:hypothetical protein